MIKIIYKMKHFMKKILDKINSGILSIKTKFKIFKTKNKLNIFAYITSIGTILSIYLFFGYLWEYDWKLVLFAIGVYFIYEEIMFDLRKLLSIKK